MWNEKLKRHHITFIYYTTVCLLCPIVSDSLGPLSCDCSTMTIHVFNHLPYMYNLYYISYYIEMRNRKSPVQENIGYILTWHDRFFRFPCGFSVTIKKNGKGLATRDYDQGFEYYSNSTHKKLPYSSPYPSHTH